MPCWTVREVSLDLTVADKGVLTRALQALNYQVQVYGEQIVATRQRDRWQVDSIRIAGGRATVTEGQESLVDEIRRGYTVEAIKTAAKKAGWNFKTDPQDQFHFTKQSRW